VEAHLHDLAVLLVDEDFALHVELLDLRERDPHLVLIFWTIRPSYVNTSVQRRPTVKFTISPKPFRNFVCFLDVGRLLPRALRQERRVRQLIFRTGVI
jgi:hypothetical protein